MELLRKLGLAPLLAAAAAVTLSAGQSNACDLDEYEVIRERDKACLRVIKATCEGTPVNIRRQGPICCDLPESRTIEWRCGGDLEPSIKCQKRASKIYIAESERGAVFQCMAALSPPDATTGSGDDQTAPATTEP